jgi:23S rRNA (adenine2503-C2)-methyltransferase
MHHPPNHIFEHTPDSLKAWCDEKNWPHFRADQIIEWVYKKGVADPLAMSNLKPSEREALAAEMTFVSGETISHQSASDGTQKLLIQWDDFKKRDPNAAAAHGSATTEAEIASVLRVINNAAASAFDPSRQTECVMIPSEERRTACISSQVGCPVGCKFCASGLGGLDGNLTAGRIVEQVWRLARLPDVGRITNIVFMGMGEPLSNFGPVTKAVRTLAAEWGPWISARKITISTVGLPKAIDRLADEMDLPVTLALSLHAPNDAIRRELIPWAQYTSINELLGACSRWFEKTGREVTLEYIMLGGVNDQESHARELADVARTIRANVNLIRYNEVAGLPFKRPGTDDVRRFQEILRTRRINTHIRASRGRDIAAACGQLRHEAASAKAG